VEDFEMEMAQRRMNPKAFYALGFLLIVALFSVLFAYVRNMEHANLKHGNDAILTRANIRNRLCLDEKFYFSPVRGTFLVLCQIEGDMWGGVPIRFTEDNGSKLIGERTYECTVHIDRWRRWQRILTRDGYINPEDFWDINVWRMFKAWFELNYR
jgi:hypothetical protein